MRAVALAALAVLWVGSAQAGGYTKPKLPPAYSGHLDFQGMAGYVDGPVLGAGLEYDLKGGVSLGGVLLWQKQHEAAGTFPIDCKTYTFGYPDRSAIGMAVTVKVRLK